MYGKIALFLIGCDQILTADTPLESHLTRLDVNMHQIAKITVRFERLGSVMQKIKSLVVSLIINNEQEEQLLGSFDEFIENLQAIEIPASQDPARVEFTKNLAAQVHLIENMKALVKVIGEPREEKHKLLLDFGIKLGELASLINECGALQKDLYTALAYELGVGK